MNNLVKLVILVGISTFATALKQSYQVTNVDVQEVLGEAESKVLSSFKLIGRQRGINGTLTFLEDLDNENYLIKMELYCSPTGNGIYKQMAMQISPDGICMNYKEYYPQFFNGTLITGVNTNFEFNDGDVCPIPKGTYWFKNIIWNTEKWVTILPRGLIKAVIVVLKNGTNIGGVLIVVKIENTIF